MRFLRFFIYGIPALLLCVLIAAFLNSFFLSTKKKNEMSIGITSEPPTLNPIQMSDATSGQVACFLFNGLIKLNQDLEIVGDLATDWTQSQITTFLFQNSEAALQARDFLASQQASHPDWGITSLELDNEKLLVTLRQPGYDIPEKIVTEFKKKLPSVVLCPFEKSDHLFLAEPIINFTLRKNVRWHDGKPFTSADVAFTYRAIMDDRVASPARFDFEVISRVETPDPDHVIVHYRHPFSSALLGWGVSILPAHLLDGISPMDWASSYNQHPIGTGPFRFEQWKKNEHVRLVRNLDYFRGPPWLDAILFRVLTDPLTLRLAFETHQIDFWAVNSWAVKSFSNDPRFDLFSEPGNSYYYIGWNLRRPLFSDLRVREAMAHAVNTPEMIRYAFYGHGVPSTGNFTPRMWFFNHDIKQLSYDPEQAKELLDAAGWKTGPDGIRCRNGKRFSFTLLISNGGGSGSDIATLMQADLKKIGIEAKLEIYEWAVFLKHVSEHDFDATVAAWSLSNDFNQHALWDSSQSHPGEMNYVGYNNPRVDELLTKLQQEYSRPEIIKLANEMQTTIYHDQPYLFLFVPQLTSVMWKDSYRVCYPTDHGWVDAPVQMTNAGWQYNMEWFYKPALALPSSAVTSGE